MGLRDLLKAAKDGHLPSMVKEAWRRGNPKQLELSSACLDLTSEKTSGERTCISCSMRSPSRCSSATRDGANVRRSDGYSAPAPYSNSVGPTSAKLRFISPSSSPGATMHTWINGGWNVCAGDYPHFADQLFKGRELYAKAHAAVVAVLIRGCCGPHREDRHRAHRRRLVRHSWFHDLYDPPCLGWCVGTAGLLRVGQIMQTTHTTPPEGTKGALR